ncbi:MAG TPA: LamG domain-containing protein [Kofleriaceae bacterium]
MGIAWAIVAALIATGCYSPRAEDCSYTCNAGPCPSGLHCVNNFCRESPEAAVACSPGGADGRIDVLPSSYPTAVLADDPIAYFRLGEMAGATQAINEIAGTGLGTYTPSVMLGTPGALSDTSTAATFDPGAGAQCAAVTSLPIYEIIAGDSFSLEAWVNLKAYSQTVNREIVGKLGAVTADAGYSLGLQWEPSLGMSRIRLRMGDGTMGESETGNGLTLDTWHHVVATFNATTMTVRFYVDGQDAGSDVFMQSSVAIESADFTIGCRDNGTLESGFDGAIDEVAFYRKVLTPMQVMTHFANR